MDATAAAPEPGVTLTVRRGLVHPFAAHPRLDLYVGASSPHPMSDFGCTVCHGGQGSATSFTWASHTPDNEADRSRWRHEHGWFGNEFWPEPMLPARFAESACLKCHHHVVDLAASERFPTTSGGQAAAGLRAGPQHGCLRLSRHHGHRRRSCRWGRICESSRSAGGRPPASLARLRRPGPSLRHLASKLDKDFIRQWIASPSQAAARDADAQSFGNLDHVPPELRDETMRRESVEIQAAAHFLLAESQPLEFLNPSRTSQPPRPKQQAQRGRELFQTAGCLICHQHREFQDAEPFREGTFDRRRPGSVESEGPLCAVRTLAAGCTTWIKEADSTRSPHADARHESEVAKVRRS
jgi:hypothetical protein